MLLATPEEPHETHEPSDYTKRIERVIAAVAASLEQEQALPSTATLAGIANFSPFHFMRVYRALAGESLGATVQRLRLTRAAHLLASSSAPISEIAGRVGFETPQAFARAFRQHFGMAPSEARAVDLASEARPASACIVAIAAGDPRGRGDAQAVSRRGAPQPGRVLEAPRGLRPAVCVDGGAWRARIHRRNLGRAAPRRARDAQRKTGCSTAVWRLRRS